MAESLSFLMIIAIIADTTSIVTFLFDVIIKKKTDRIYQRILLIVVLFAFTVMTYFLTPNIVFGLNVDYILLVAGVLYLIISTIGMCAIAYLMYGRVFSGLDFTVNILCATIPMFLGIVAMWLIEQPIDFFAALLLYISAFQIMLMAKNYIVNRLIDKNKTKSARIHGKTVNPDYEFNIAEFGIEFGYAFLPYTFGFLLLIFTNENYFNRFSNSINFENRSWILTRDTTYNITGLKVDENDSLINRSIEQNYYLDSLLSIDSLNRE